MPLPTEANTPWPPRPRKVYREMARHAAWYSGDTDRLKELYGAGGSPARRPSEGGGFVQRVSNWFWGRRGVDDPLKTGGRLQLHVPLASDIATTSADLLFAEPPTFKIPESVDASARPEGGDNAETQSDASRAQARLDTLIEEGGLDNSWLEMAELASALGGAYLRPVWERELVDRPLLGLISADEAAPEFFHGVLRAVTFWRILEVDGNKVIRHLERHEPGVILHGLFESSDFNKLGRRLALTDHEETRNLADSLTDSDVIELKGWPDGMGPMVRYVPNIRPNRKFKTEHARSDLQGIEGLMDALDETYTSLIRDIRLGVRRVIVAQDYLTGVEGRPEQGRWFNIDQELFTALDIDTQAMMQGGEKGIQPIDFEIRTQAHFDAAVAIRDEAISTAGYSPESFRPSADGVPESGIARKQRERKSAATTAKKERYVKAPMADIAEIMLFIDKTIFENDTPVLRPTVSFSDFTAETAGERAQSAKLLRDARMASIETGVRMVHPDWTDDEVGREVERIEREEGVAVPTITPEELNG